MSTVSEWIDKYAYAYDGELYCLEPRSIYDQAIVGIADGMVVYDRIIVITLLQSSSEMSREDAVEYHYFNQDSMDLWLFLDRPELPEINDFGYVPPLCDPSLN